MSAWTTGPWKYDMDAHDITAPDGTSIVMDALYISVEDARLIAAAPEMAEFLEEVIDVGPEGGMLVERARVLLARIAQRGRRHEPRR